VIAGLFGEKHDRPASAAEVRNNKFALNLPSGWQDQSVFRFQGPEEDGIQHNIIITIGNDIGMDLEEWADRNIRAVEEELQGLQELKRGTLVLDNQMPGYEYVYRWTPMEDREIYQRVIYVLQKGTGYMLTASFSKKTWKTFGPVVDKILMSFAPDGITRT